MSKDCRTYYQLNNMIEEDYSWRAKELRTIKLNLKKDMDSAHFKSSIVLSYSHWEGFIKTSGFFYLNYVSLLKLKMSRLDSRYAALWIRKEIGELLNVKSMKKNGLVLEMIRGKENGRANLPYRDIIDTGANLNWSYFEDIAYLVNLSVDEYQIRENWIDEILLRKRNKIAHGEKIPVNYEEAIDVIEGVLSLLVKFKDDILFSASNEFYLKEKKRRKS